MLPRRRSCLAASTTLMLALGLSSCATGDAPETSASSPAAPGAQQDCQEPPETPTSAQQFDRAPDPSTAAGKTFTATIKTTCGDIVLELDGAKAPQTVASFRHLATSNYWKDSPCHRLTAGGSLSVLQCGDPTGQGNGDPGYRFGVENAPEDGSYPEGTVAMARGESPDTNGGQFFLVHADSTIPSTSGGYSIFAKVVDGTEVLRKVTSAGVEGGQQDGRPEQPISILSVTVTEKKA